MVSRDIILVLATSVGLTSLSAQASEPCDSFKKTNPAAYEAYCKNGGGSSKPAGAGSTFNSSFNINPAGLPNEKSPYGLEAIGSTVNGYLGSQFALIKGFSKFGAGISTGSANTFYGNDLYQRIFKTSELQDFHPNETPRGKYINLNIGTSFELFKVGNSGKLSLGLSGRYNKITNNWGGGPALLFSGKFLTFGTGFSSERVSNRLARAMFYSYTVSVKLLLLEFQYDQLRETSASLNQLSPIHIGTATLSIHRLIATVAARRLNYLNEGMITQYHQGIQFLVSSHLSLGVLHNFIPGTYSLGLQYFF